MNETEAKKKVFIVDDHPIVRHGLGQLINRAPDLVVCGEAATHEEALEMIARTRPDILLADICLKESSGLALVKEVQEKFGGLPSLVLSMHDESLYAERALRAGAKGYIMKEQADESVVDGIRKVLQGELCISGAMQERMLKQYVGQTEEVEDAKPSVEALSDREREVFDLMGHGLSSQRIAEKLGLSAKTVEVHRTHIKKKLRVDDGAQLMREAVRWVERGSV
ncbi:MAG: response regulator transcription factor [Spartobacteria bacterium]|nr:response regulator transcription factor [Spartobacteria bacterium]